MSQPRAPRPTLRFVAYLGPRRLTLFASTFAVDRSHAPYKRPSASLLLACRNSLQVETADGTCVTSKVVLVAPQVSRRRLAAVDSDLVLVDFPVRTPEYFALEPVLGERPLLELGFERFAHLLPVIERGFAGALQGAEVKALHRDLVQAICGRAPQEHVMDPRVVKALQLIDELPFAQATLSAIAARLHLSASRFGHLFKEQTGTSFSAYVRWVAVWRMVTQWKQGMPLTEVAHAVGFYDLAHADHAFIETFGINPSSAIDPDNVTLVRYT
ncbi:MAG: AraC family transcriptional regulator [Nevskia sp.]|nr:AraC family transcriptional regulator [Nevskia sp.]